MPIALLLLIIQIVFIVHAAKTGRFNPWGYILLFLPGVGALAYVVVELIPEVFGSSQGQRARKGIAQTLNPERLYRELADQVAIADTIANRLALAEECLALEKFEEARGHYENILARPLGEEPAYMLGVARAQFGGGKLQDAVKTLEALRVRWPDYQSADGHLLYARGLEESGRLADAIEEYRALADYYPGAEARVRYGLILRKAGRETEAKLVFTDVLTHMRRAPKYVRKAQAKWIAIAEKQIRG